MPEHDEDEIVGEPQDVLSGPWKLKKKKEIKKKKKCHSMSEGSGSFPSLSTVPAGLSGSDRLRLPARLSKL